MSKYDEIFNDNGMMARPTMRGSANLDAQDYAGWSGRSSILDDELQEDTPSTPGRNPGAASATDVDGTSDWDFLEGDMDTLGMKQTTYGDSPWGPGSDTGYRPYSQQRTDMSLRALSGEDHQPEPAVRDSMTMEPEVTRSLPSGVQEVGPWDEEWHGNRNQMPSNEGILPDLIYDRSSFEYDNSSQNVIGTGIFGMEEGVTWRSRDGSFANQYAEPAYIGEEDELGVQQSEMYDTTADEWRVTQPSASGVALARRVGELRPAYSPFAMGDDAPPPQMRPEVTGPRSHVEAFGRKAARCVIEEAQGQPMQARNGFLVAAIEALGPGSAQRARSAADALVKLGYRQDVAFEDALAHLVMHAAANDLSRKKASRSALPRLDRMAAYIRSNQPKLRAAAAQHIAPLTEDNGKLRSDLGALYASPAGRGLGQVTNGSSPAVPEPSPTMLSGKNLLIAGGIGVGAYLLYANRDKLKKNLKKLVK